MARLTIYALISDEEAGSVSDVALLEGLRARMDEVFASADPLTSIRVLGVDVEDE